MLYGWMVRIDVNEDDDGNKLNEAQRTYKLSKDAFIECLSTSLSTTIFHPPNPFYHSLNYCAKVVK